MRLGCFLLIALVLPGGCQRSRQTSLPKAVPVRADGALMLKVMSFNVRYENPQDINERSWARRVVGSVKLLAVEKPDIFGVQEAMHAQVADLRASLPDYEFHGHGRDDGKRTGEYAGIFYRKDRFEADPGDKGVFWLSDTPEVPGSRTWGNQFPRLVEWVRLVDRATGRGFYVFNTHWDHRQQVARERSALLMAKRISGRLHSEDPVIVTGDFNAVEANPAILYLLGKSANVAGMRSAWPDALLDTFQVLHPGDKNRRTLHLWKFTREGTLKVDHIFVSKGAIIQEAKVLSQSKTMVSDHYPVSAKVLFR